MPDVCVMGAGAVGAYYGACLARAGCDVAFVARGDNLAAMRSDGIAVTGAMGEFVVDDVTCGDDPAAFGRAELTLLGVKNYDLTAAAEATNGLSDLYLTLQNGVDAPHVVAAIVGDRVLAGTTGIVADLVAPGRVHLTSAYAWIRFGEPNGGGVTQRVSRVAALLDVDGVEPLPAEDARLALWEKMALMCGMAGLTTLHQRPIGEILDDAELRRTFERIVDECADIARAKGVPIADDFVAKRIHYAERIDPSAMSSMSRDLARGRRIELETFNGAIVRMGAEEGIDVKTNRAVYDAIAAKR
jgi:2-dehydropantoate 2-reductase